MTFPVYSRARMRRALGSGPLPAYSQSPVFSARDIYGLAPVAWFQFNTGITVATGVSQWNDQSGNGRHLLQATGASQPAKQADGSILFDGTDDSLKCTGFTFNQPETIYMLFKQVSWTTNDNFFDGNADATGVLRQTSGGVSPNIEAFAGTVFGTTSHAGPAIGTYGICIVIFNGASSLLQTNNAAPDTGAGGANNMGGFTLGTRGTAAGWANIQVKEVILFAAAHDAATRARVIAYLQSVNTK